MPSVVWEGGEEGEGGRRRERDGGEKGVYRLQYCTHIHKARELVLHTGTGGYCSSFVFNKQQQP